MQSPVEIVQPPMIGIGSFNDLTAILKTLSDAQFQDACRRSGVVPDGEQTREDFIKSIKSILFRRYVVSIPIMSEFFDGQKNWKPHYPKTFSRPYFEHLKGIFADSRGNDFLKLSLVCPITFTRIRNPVRFKWCTHLSCIDQASWEHLQATSGHFMRCPECQKKVNKQDAMKDELLPEILADPDTQDVDHVFVKYFKEHECFEWKLPDNEELVDLTDGPADEPEVIVESVAKRKRGRPTKYKT